jgi:hypothetical protein
MKEGDRVEPQPYGPMFDPVVLRNAQTHKLRYLAAGESVILSHGQPSRYGRGYDAPVWFGGQRYLMDSRNLPGVSLA